MSEKIIDLAIADDHKLMRQALITALSAHGSYRFIFEADNGIDLLSQLSQHKPHVLLLDIRMPRLSGIEALKIVSEKYPDVRVLMFSGMPDDFYVAQCLELGIYGYLTKSMEITSIIEAIELAYNFQVYSTNLLNNVLYRKYLVEHGKKSQILPSFTNEEVQILDLMKEERTTEEISSMLHLSKRSIEVKRDKMRQKVNAKTNGGLLLYAFKRGLIQ